MSNTVYSMRDKHEFNLVLDDLQKRVGIHARHFAVLMALWGLRVSDLLNIKWVQIDEGLRLGAFDIIEAKTGKKKSITLSQGAIKTLEAMRSYKRKSDIYLFQSRRCSSPTPISRKTAWRWLSDSEHVLINHRRANGISLRVNLGTHSLRKAGGRLRVKSGECSLEDIKQLLNHSNIMTTLIYLDLGADDLASTFERGDAALL